MLYNFGVALNKLTNPVCAGTLLGGSDKVHLKGAEGCMCNSDIWRGPHSGPLLRAPHWRQSRAAECLLVIVFLFS